MKTQVKQKFAFRSAVAICCLTLAAAAQAAPLPLHAQGPVIADSAGHEVTLRGVNLGGWLVEEPWMQPFETKPPAGTDFVPITDHVTLWEVMKKRLGNAGMEQARTDFRNAWVTEADFDRLHALGLNCVRLPFLASLLDEPNGVQWLDKAVGWAGARSMYVILDMHGAPGSQSDQDHTGQTGLNEFFKKPANIARAAEVWTRLASHFADNPAVAGYDLLNEPTGTPNSDTLYVVQGRLVSAIRAADTHHIIFMEDGYTGVQWMPFPEPCGWQNISYSTHYYNFNAKTAADQTKTSTDYINAQITERDRRHIPYFVGEFGMEPNGTPASLLGMLNAMEDKQLSYTSWTYKMVVTGGGQSLWAFYSSIKPVTALDPYHDTAAQWAAKCGEVRTENLDENAPMTAAFQKAARQAKTAAALSQ